MSDPLVPEFRIHTSLSGSLDGNNWRLNRSASSDSMQKTDEGGRIVVSHDPPPEGAQDGWPMTTIQFVPRDQAERVLMPIEGSYQFLDEPQTMPVGTSLTFHVKGCIDPKGEEEEWRLGYEAGATVPCTMTLNSPSILIQC